MATGTIFHSRLRCNFKKLLPCHCTVKIATWLHGVPAKFASRKFAMMFRIYYFSSILQVLALSAQDMLHTEICMCNSNAMKADSHAHVASDRMQSCKEPRFVIDNFL